MPQQDDVNGEALAGFAKSAEKKAFSPGVMVTTHNGPEFLPGPDLVIAIYADGTLDVTKDGEIIYAAAPGEWRRARRDLPATATP